jgi:hypothetical protein
MIGLINDAIMRLRDDLDMRQARDDASNVVQFMRPVVISQLTETFDTRA